MKCYFILLFFPSYYFLFYRSDFLTIQNCNFVFSVELRELEAKLKAGYMNQERAAQLAEKRVLEIDEQVCNQTQNHVYPNFMAMGLLYGYIPLRQSMANC